MISNNAACDPVVSVLLPVFNGGDYLDAAVRSILVQDFVDFELLVIDDGSTDCSLAVLRSLAEGDERIRIISRENRGLVVTLNEGIRAARGRYIARMDADDIAHPSRLRLQADYLEKSPECVCVGSDVELMDELGRKLVVLKQLARDEDIQTMALKGHTTICHPAAMIRKSALMQLGGYRTEMYPAEDLDLWLRLGEIGKLANLNQVLLRYRMHDQSISGLAARNGRQRDAAKRCCDSACSRRGILVATFVADAAWRPDGSSNAELEYDLKFGWWAYQSEEYRTAAAYGWSAWRREPLSKTAFMLFFKSVIYGFFNRGRR